MLSPILITPPAAAPVSLAEARQHLRVDHTDEDALIASLIEAAVGHFDGWSGILGRCLEPQTWELALDAFPAKEIRLPLGPIASVASVRLTDPSGAELTVSPLDYETDLRAVEGWIVPSAGWPATMDVVNAVRVRWVAGTGCPEPVRHAILLLIGHWYAHREAASAAASELPLGVSALIAPWRRVGI